MGTVKLPSRTETGKKSESVVQSEIRKHVGSLPYVRIWRNNTGQIKDSRGIPVKFGLCVGSSDLICIVAPSGRMAVIEVKEEGWTPAKSGARFKHEEEQRQFIAVVEKFGGAGGFASSVDEAMVIIGRAMRL